MTKSNEEAALSAALSVQPAAAVVGEPVAWMVEDGTDHAFVTFIPAVRDEQASKGCDITALYTASRISQQDAELERMRSALRDICTAIEREPIVGDLDYPHAHNDWRGWRKKVLRPAAEKASALLKAEETAR